MTPKQARFVEEYLIDLNATQAAIRSGYSPKTANEQGARLLANASVRQAVQEARARRSERVTVTQDWVVEQLARIASVDVREFFTAGGALRSINELPEEVASALASFEVATVNRGEGEVEHVAKIKTNDRLRALELLGRHLGIFNDKLNLNVTGGLSDRLARARQRATKRGE